MSELPNTVKGTQWVYNKATFLYVVSFTSKLDNDTSSSVVFNNLMTKSEMSMKAIDSFQGECEYIYRHIDIFIFRRFTAPGQNSAPEQTRWSFLHFHHDSLCMWTVWSYFWDLGHAAFFPKNACATSNALRSTPGPIFPRILSVFLYKFFLALNSSSVYLMYGART